MFQAGERLYRLYREKPYIHAIFMCFFLIYIVTIYLLGTLGTVVRKSLAPQRFEAVPSTSI
jgi:hypothetical protein